MAQIQKYTAQRSLSAPGAPSTNLQSYEGSALQGLGGAIQDVAAAFNKQNEDKENFKAADGYKNLQLKLGEEMNRRAEGMAEDGSGFHDGFMKEVYNPLRSEFLGSLPPRLRERFETQLGDDGSDTTAWSINSANRERDQLYGWYDGKLATSQEQLATAISLAPDDYDNILQWGMEEIEQSGLPPGKKKQHRENWERMAQAAHLNKMVETRPGEVLKDLDADFRTLSPSTQVDLLVDAVEWQESKGDPNAVSNKGAAGLMQVMPATAREIAREMGDANFNPKWSDDEVRNYLFNPATGKAYGIHYLRKMNRQFGSHGPEAVLIAYNGGPKRAQDWIKSGYDDSVIPSETRNYYKSILGRLGSPGSSRAPSNVKLTFNRDGKTEIAGQDEDHLHPDLVKRVKTAFSGLGIDEVRITSGFRSEADNRRVGGAQGSQHRHGSAMDIDVSGKTHEQRVAIIRALSANGITGFGIGANMIHADIGARRAWGYASSSGGGEVPKWAKGVIDEHLAGNIKSAPSAGRVKDRYASLPYSDRQRFIAAADKNLASLTSAAKKNDAIQKYEVKTSVQNELAAVQSTGQFSPGFDETRVAEVLGEADYLKFIDDRASALRMYEGVQGMGSMTVGEMEERYRDYEPDPNSPTFVSDQKVQAAILKEQRRVETERTKRPDRAAMAYPEVQAAWEAISGVEDPQPEAVQEYVRINLETQREFGLKEGSEMAVPREWAMSIGRDLSRIPQMVTDAPDTLSKNQALQYVVMQYHEEIQKTFGDYSEEVIIQSLAEFKGMSKETAEAVTGMMRTLDAGGDPFRRVRARLEQSQEIDDVESASEGRGFFGTIGAFLFGDDDENPTAPPDPGEPDFDDPSLRNERVLRIRQAITNFGGEISSEQEQQLRRRYGNAAVDAALSETVE